MRPTHHKVEDHVPDFVAGGGGDVGAELDEGGEKTLQLEHGPTRPVHLRAARRTQAYRTANMESYKSE